MIQVGVCQNDIPHRTALDIRYAHRQASRVKGDTIVDDKTRQMLLRGSGTVGIE